MIGGSKHHGTSQGIIERSLSQLLYSMVATLSRRQWKTEQPQEDTAAAAAVEHETWPWLVEAAGAEGEEGGGRMKAEARDGLTDMLGMFDTLTPFPSSLSSLSGSRLLSCHVCTDVRCSYMYMYMSVS